MVSQSAMHVNRLVDRPFLAADVGGTHARVGLMRRARDGRLCTLGYATYVGADHQGLSAILQDFLEAGSTAPVSHCVLACAGYAIDDVVINANLPWPVDIQQLRRALHLEDLALINDFEAVAHAAPHIEAHATTLLSTCSDGRDDSPVIVVGPGTGLGSAVFIPATPRPMVLATEAGQINLAPGNALEAEILAILARSDSYVSYEHVLSGPGLLTLYRALCEHHGARAQLTDPEAVSRGALHGGDAIARQTLHVFCALLGSFVGDLAMLYGASGGVYLAGGIVPHIREFLQQSAFLSRFLAKGRMRAFLERVPVRLTEHGQLGVVGAASWYLQQEDAAS